MKYLFVISFLFVLLFANGQEVDFVSSNLPIFVIETDGDSIVDEPKVEAFMGVIDNGEGERNHINDPYNNYAGTIGIEIRGHTSQSYPKKQYGFETRLPNGENNNVSLLGLPEENDWILSAPYADKTLMRNVLTREIFARMGHYAPRMRFCELVLNGKYQGVYVLSEKIKRDKNRVDISKLKEDEVWGDDLTGGYLLKIDRPSESDFYWITALGNYHVISEYPDRDEIQEVQKEYIRSYIDSFEVALYNPEALGNNFEYTDFIDVNSFVDFFIVNELAKNIDAYRLSTFMYKDKASNGGKLTMGPVWDFNIAYGNAEHRYAYRHGSFVASSAAWWSVLINDSTFVQLLEERWEPLRKTVLKKENLYTMIDSLAFCVEEARARNFKQWDVLGVTVWPNYFVGDNYLEEITYLKEWLDNRIDWMDRQIGRRADLADDFEVIAYSNPIYERLILDIELKTSCNLSILVYSSDGKLLETLVDNRPYERGFWNVNVELKSRMQKNHFYFISAIVNGAHSQTIKVLHY